MLGTPSPRKKRIGRLSIAKGMTEENGVLWIESFS